MFTVEYQGRTYRAGDFAKARNEYVLDFMYPGTLAEFIARHYPQAIVDTPADAPSLGDPGQPQRRYVHTAWGDVPAADNRTRYVHTSAVAHPVVAADNDGGPRPTDVDPYDAAIIAENDANHADAWHTFYGGTDPVTNR